MASNNPFSLASSFERHLRGPQRSPRTIEQYLRDHGQAELSLATRGRTLLDAASANLEDFLVHVAALPPRAWR